MNPIKLASWRRPMPHKVAPSAGVSGTLHAAVLAVALFGYPVIDIVFGPSSGVPGDVLSYGKNDKAGGSGEASALDINATVADVKTSGGIDPNNDVPTNQVGEHAWNAEGDSPEPQTRAGKPDTAPVPPTASSAEPTRKGRPDGLPDGTSHQLAAREIIVMVTLNPEEPERLDGSKAGNRQIADSDGSDDGQDERTQAAQAAQPVGGLPDAELPPEAEPAATPVIAIARLSDNVDRGPLADAPETPELERAQAGTKAAEAVDGPYRPDAEITDAAATQPNADPREAPNGLDLAEFGRLLDIAPSAGGMPAAEAAPETIAERIGEGNADDEKNNRLRDIVIAVTGNDVRFARAILDPQPIVAQDETPDPAKQQRIRLLQEAANAGYTRAQFALARQYIIGEQPQATMREAIMLLREAAERGDIDAQLLLGVIYAQGKIARQDLVESQLYLTLAAAQGAEGIDEILQEIERDMTLEELIAARRIGRTYSRILSALDVPRMDGTRGDLLRDELLDAAAAGNAATIAKALARGADIEATDGAGRTAVINAAWRGRSDAVDLLLTVGATVDTRDDRGRTALTWAVSNGHEAVVRQLVAAGAEIDPVDSDGTTPLMRAAWNGHRTVVESLLQAGADADHRDAEGKGYSDYLARYAQAGTPTIGGSRVGY